MSIPIGTFVSALDAYLPRTSDNQIDCIWLANRCGLKEDHLYRLFREKESVRFDLADLIITRLHANEVWHTTELADLYEEIPLTCARPGCEKELAGKQKIYCSRQCQNNWGQILRKRARKAAIQGVAA